MYLPPLQPITNSDIRISGEVEIHPTASIASGVILQAAPNSRIVIGVDVCIGMGTIISASGGVVEIADGATLGSGVLIVGQSKVGNNACVGTASTIFNATVESMAVVTPGAIIGDVSRQETINPVEKQVTEDKPSPTQNTNIANSNGHLKRPKKEQTSSTKANSANNKQNLANNKFIAHQGDPWAEKDSVTNNFQQEASLSVTEIETSIKAKSDPTVSRVYLDRLLVTLFPHKKNLNNNSLPDKK